MTTLQETLKDIVLRSAVAVACSIIVGMIFYGLTVFNPYRHTFMFVLDAAVASLLFFALRYAAPRNVLLFLLVTYLVYMGPLVHVFRHGWVTIRNFTIFFAATPFAVYVYFRSFYLPHRFDNVVRPVVVASLTASTTIIARLLVDIISWGFAIQWLDYPLHIFPEVAMGFLLGLGIGIGFEIVDLPSFSQITGTARHA